jgi:hypothetical protein
VKPERTPGRYIREEDLRRLPGVIEYTPTARYSYSAGQALSEFLRGRGEAGGVQLKDVRRAVVASWRGPPTYTSIVAVVSRD